MSGDTSVVDTATRADGARRLLGIPTAVARQCDLVLALTESDLRFRYGRGTWRFLRLLLDPFALVGIYLILVVVVATRPGHAPGLSLACAVIPFQYLMSTVTNAMGAVDLRRPIVLNMAFKRMLLPISSVVTETVSFAVSFVIIVLMMAIYEVAPTAALGWLPLVVLVTAIFSTSFAYPAALFGVWFPRGMRPFALSFMRMLFFLGPGLIPLERTSGWAHTLLALNPLSGLFESFRDLFYYGQGPAVWELLYPLGFSLLLLLAFVPAYHSEQRHFAKVVE